MRKGIAGESLRGGTRPGGFGGLLSPEQAERLRQKDARNRDRIEHPGARPGRSEAAAATGARDPVLESHRAVMPPSTTMHAPTTDSASSEARYAAMAAISSGVTNRPCGWRACMAALAAAGSS